MTLITLEPQKIISQPKQAKISFEDCINVVTGLFGVNSFYVEKEEKVIDLVTKTGASSGIWLEDNRIFYFECLDGVEQEATFLRTTDLIVFLKNKI